VFDNVEIACAGRSPLQITCSGPAERLDREDVKASAATWTFDAGAFAQWMQLSDVSLWLYSI
jgi:hypothetical protein